MARAPKIYRKLIGRRGGIGSLVTLWIAADHVLLVEANLFTERYQRMWFQDIHGFFERPSREAELVIWISLGFFVAGLGLAVFGGGGAGVLDAVGWVVAITSGVTLIYGVFFARQCHFHAVSAVQCSEWANVARRRQARKVIARLEPLIRAAQADAATALHTEMPPLPPGFAVSTEVTEA